MTNSIFLITQCFHTYAKHKRCQYIYIYTFIMNINIDNNNIMYIYIILYIYIYQVGLGDIHYYHNKIRSLT